jgi:hypothetical protein
MIDLPFSVAVVFAVVSSLFRIDGDPGLCQRRADRAA